MRFIEIIMSILLLCSYANAQNIFDEVESSGGKGHRVGKFQRNDRQKGEIKDLRKLEKFNDIAVIQKKYLNKSNRLEIWTGGSLALNSQFYNFLGLNVALTYHLDETWGIELEGLVLTDLQKNITQNLEDKQNIVTRSIVVPSNYFGAHIRWSPIYGKISLREKTINPFEMHFTLGGGLSGIEDGQRVPTVHFGIGQVYPITKNKTFRWALGYNFFQADAQSDLQGSISGNKVNTGFLYISAGLSIFLPFSRSR